MVGFAREGDAVVARFEPDETTLLRRLLDEMRILLEADIPASDAVLTRLFPRAYEQPEDEAAYRDLVVDELHATKLGATLEARAALEGAVAATLHLEPDQAERFLALLTDLRLAIGVRLDVDEEMMSADIDPDDPDAPALSVLHWLGWVQGTMLEAMTGGETT